MRLRLTRVCDRLAAPPLPGPLPRSSVVESWSGGLLRDQQLESIATRRTAVAIVAAIGTFFLLGILLAFVAEWAQRAGWPPNLYVILGAFVFN